jgi:hypothetical protein
LRWREKYPLMSNTLAMAFTILMARWSAVELGVVAGIAPLPTHRNFFR